MTSPGNPFTRGRFFIALLAAVVAAPLAAAPAPPSGTKPATPGAPKPTLVFFMNPAGGPCRTQDEILMSSRARWEPLANLRYVRTDVAADREAFYKFGVRSLPNLILVGADGKEVHRYSPGIQSAETILSGILAKPDR
jgi:thioredoxin 1